ncbi:MAG TPA: hypothetical protein VFI22_05265 [Thermomicrobiales bacterium]|nr:hypothetical protein [Thermomicrobiales bacterium]
MTDRSAPAPADEPAASEPLPPERDAEAAALIAATGREPEPAGLLAALRADPAATLYGVVKNGALAAVYGLKKVGLTLELRPLAAASNWDEWLALKEAVARAGRWSVVVETSEADAATYLQMGFRKVSRRRGPDGEPRYRLGWHTPTRRHPR